MLFQRFGCTSTKREAFPRLNYSYQVIQCETQDQPFSGRKKGGEGKDKTSYLETSRVYTGEGNHDKIEIIAAFHIAIYLHHRVRVCEKHHFQRLKTVPKATWARSILVIDPEIRCSKQKSRHLPIVISS